MNRHIIDNRQIRRFAPLAVAATLLFLIFLVISGFALEGLRESDSLLGPTTPLGGLALPDLFPAFADGPWVATQGIAGGLILLILLLGAFGLTSFAVPRNNKMYWMKQLIHSEETSVKCVATKELGSIRGPDVLLILIDVADDEVQDPKVREAALRVLHEISAALSKKGNSIAVLESALGKGDPQALIGALKRYFGKAGKGHLQCACVIGRQYMKLGRYSDAREWLNKARRCDRKMLLYGNRIEELINTCNDSLLAEGDALFMAGNYHGAREHYALLSHDLADREKKRFALFLRSACVYCKLKDYRDADQAVLQALRFDQETDKSLALIQLLHKLQDGGAEGRRAEDSPERIRQSIDEYISGLMERLSALKGPMTAALASAAAAAARF